MSIKVLIILYLISSAVCQQNSSRPDGAQNNPYRRPKPVIRPNPYVVTQAPPTQPNPYVHPVKPPSPFLPPVEACDLCTASDAVFSRQDYLFTRIEFKLEAIKQSCSQETDVDVEVEIGEASNTLSIAKCPHGQSVVACRCDNEDPNICLGVKIFEKGTICKALAASTATVQAIAVCSVIHGHYISKTASFPIITCPVGKMVKECWLSARNQVTSNIDESLRNCYVNVACYPYCTLTALCMPW